jgi:hypothetical protein
MVPRDKKASEGLRAYEDELTKPGISRRAFIHGTVGVAGATMAGTPALLGAAHATADIAQVKSSRRDSEKCSVNRLQRASKGYQPRYPGPRWHLIYGNYSGEEKFALDELQKMIQRYVPYVVEIRHSVEELDQDANHILVGTAVNNPQIAERAQRGALAAPTKPQGYSIVCSKSPLNSERRSVVIAGADSAGVLYGVVDFNKRLAGVTPDDPKEMRQTLDNLAEFSLQDAPLIENRGIWSWGFVIYDYRRFLDNMARLRMNRLLFGNDVPPVNCQEIIDYAHSRGIKVVLGFSWGWGYDPNTFDPTSQADRQVVKDEVLCQIAEYFQHLGMDAIYFQSFTETRSQEIGGKPIALLARDWVNDIAAAVLNRYPEMKIEWGLHASSILAKYKYLESLDPRVVIVWEDAGVIPYSYDPVTAGNANEFPAMLNSPAATREYSKQLATFREHSEFAMVAKGWISMRWRTEFEHHGPFILGERAPGFIRNRSRERQPRWDFVNNLWLQNYPEALRFYQQVRNCTSSNMTVLALIEDGLFEEKIRLSAALFAEMTWNPRRSGKDVLEQAANPYYVEIE